MLLDMKQWQDQEDAYKSKMKALKFDMKNYMESFKDIRSDDPRITHLQKIVNDLVTLLVGE